MPTSCDHSHSIPTTLTTTSDDRPYCMHCHYTIGHLKKKLQYKPRLIHKINHLKTIMYDHTTRDEDNNLICPTLKAYYCPKCKHEGRGLVYGHTPSRCSPCEYCNERGHNERECPNKRADEKDSFTTIVFKIPKNKAWEQAYERFLAMAAGEDFDIVKVI